LVFPETTYALDAPDDTDIREVYVFRNLLTDDVVNYDQLYVVHYDIAYAVTPLDYTVKESFIFELRDGAGALIGSQLAYAYANSGYGQGVVAFYFDETEAPAWGGGYTVRITKNPVIPTVIPNHDMVLDATNYSASTDHETNQQALADTILDICEYLESEWLISLTSEQDSGTTLSSSGEKYFRTTIAGIQTMAPALFFLQSATIDTSTRTWGSSLSETYESRLYGADGISGTADDNWMKIAIQRPLDELNISYTLGIGLLVVIICVILVWQSHKHFQSAMPGYVGSCIVILAAGILTLGFAVIFFVALLLVLAGGWLLFMKKA